MRVLAFVTVLLLSAAAACFADLRVGLMPAENSFPLVAAAEKGYFAAEGVAVELVPFSSQLNREAALQSGSIDGSVSDLINAVQGWANGAPVVVTSATEGAFSLLVSPRSALTGLEAWKGRRVRTGLLENSVVYYVTEGLLARAGRDPGDIELVPIVPVPVRMEMLLAGQIEACCLPEPMGAVAESRGARRIADSSALGFTPGVMVFTKAAAERKAGELRAFYRAYNRGVAELNANGPSYRQAIVRTCGFPEPLAVSLRIPQFRPAFVPSAQELSDVAAWMVRKGLLKGLPRYTDVVLPSLVP
jgi:NitT/TauT family transport system substrate-binding protein